MLWVCVLCGAALAVGVWAVALRPRAEQPADDAAWLAAEGPGSVDAGSGAGQRPVPAGDAAAGDRLVACLERLFVDDGPAGEAALFAGRNLPPHLVRNVARLTSGMAGGTALARLQDPSPSPRRLAATIGLDPLLTGTVLKIANSPLFGPRCEVTSLEQAIGILGLTNLRTLLCAELFEQAATGIPLVLRRSLWSHLGKTAVVARHIAPALSGLDPRALHTMGLLHDVGRLVLHGRGDAAFAMDVLAEEEAYGANHAVAGWAVCAGFDLPEAVCQGVRLHHAPCFVEMEDLDADVAAIRHGLAVCLADRLVWILDGGDPAERPGVRTSYRFLVNEAVLARLIVEEGLRAELDQTAAMLGLAGA